MRDPSDTPAVRLRTKNNNLQYHDGGTYQNVMNIVANKWYHLRIDFDCNAETFDLYVDGTKKVDDGAFYASVDSVSKFRVGTHSTNKGYYTYIDAVGYSRNRIIYSFTQDQIGSNPDGWTIDESGGIVNVIAGIDGHSKVLELFDTNPCYYVEAVQQFAAQTSGTVEFYFRVGNSNLSLTTMDYSLRDASDNLAIKLRTINDNLQYHDGGAYQNIMNIEANKWYHLRIAFDCNVETFDLYFDGIKKVDDGAFYASVDSVSKFRVGTDSCNIRYYIYIDAVGYSWNIKNYSFTQDEIGSNPEGWTIGESGGTVNVIAGIDGRSKVLELYDTNSSYNIEAVQQFTPQTSGTVKFYFRVGDIASNRRFYCLRDASDTLAISLRTKNDDLQYHDGGTYQNVMNIVANKWYHLRIEFDCNAETFDLYIDGTKKVDDGAFYASVDSVSKFRVGTHSTNKGYYTYIDEVGYSWDEKNYNIGDNLNEGLLLSFKTNPNIVFHTFELDDEALIEVLGNATIPMPSNGVHSIQVFGTDYRGIYYQSEIRWFSVWI
ncbi:MAG: hypothetical protein ACFFAN_02340 [Promethearchaeota archaeon]